MSRQSSMLKKSLLNKPGFFEIGRRFGCSEWSVKRYDEFSTTEVSEFVRRNFFRGAFFETGADVTFFISLFFFDNGARFDSPNSVFAEASFLPFLLVSLKSTVLLLVIFSGYPHSSLWRFSSPG